MTSPYLSFTTYAPFSLQFLYADDSPSSKSAGQMTWSNVPLGTPHAERFIVVCPYSSAFEDVLNVTSVTVAGISASSLGSGVTSSNYGDAISAAAVPTGGKGD